MEITYQLSLGLHVISGFTALLCGLLAMIFKKGGKQHILSGKIFFFAMTSVCFSALLISVMKGNQFLFAIGIFSFYQLMAGYRSIKNKSLQPAWYDWLLLLIGTANAIQMVMSLHIVLLVFGSLSLFQMVGEFLLFRKATKPDFPKNAWLRRHIGMMMGSYIATRTAFIVVNIKEFEPAWLPWILPTFIFTPVIVYYTRKFTGPKPKKQTI
jgi:uncharacterized membrane protein